MEQTDIQRAIAAILFAAGECVGAQRMAQAIGCETEQIHEQAQGLMDNWNFERSGVRIVRLEDAYQMCSSAEMAQYVTRALETRRPPKLSGSQLEALTVIAYYQPATKAYVEQTAGWTALFHFRQLLNKKLIEECGRLAVPGRPILYRTTANFLRTFGLESLEDLPEIDTISFDPQKSQLQMEELLQQEEAQ